MLRVFPEELPGGELNTKIDELFVPAATNTLPQTASEFQSWREGRLAELRRLVFRSLPEKYTAQFGIDLTTRKIESGELITEPGISVAWKYFPARQTKSGRELWLVTLVEEE